MNKKKAVNDLKIKLKRLGELKDDQYNYESLNDYSKYLNNVIEGLKLKTIVKARILSSGDGSAGGYRASVTEVAAREALINKYGEALTEINPSHGTSILEEFKTTSGKLKLFLSAINIGTIIAAATFAWRIGSGERDEYEKKISSQKELIAGHETELTQLKGRVANLNDTVSALRIKLRAEPAKPKQRVIVSQPNSKKDEILKVGQTFIDKETGASLAILRILPDHRAKVTYKVPSDNSWNIDPSSIVALGQSIPFHYKNKDYKLILTELDSTSNHFNAIVKKMDD